ncbi:MAG: pilus (MSHA type) biogenesis protein MshL [Deltaproteobacteria bacterium]|nr:pilus (MSHA type) biogenesis protein MshL [Deltaproteobacteria bacterium]
MPFSTGKIYPLIPLLIFFMSCSTLEIPRAIKIPDEAAKVVEEVKAPVEPVVTPEFVPAREELSPLQQRIVDLSARNTPLRDILYVISESTNLNLVMENDVNPDIPITLTLKNVTAGDALDTVFRAVDYFYTIKNNLLIVKTTDTRTFELGHPAITQSYDTDLGGDMLGAAASSGTSTSGGSSDIKGSITQKSEIDKEAYKFWDVIEKTIGGILGLADGKAAAPAPPAPALQPGMAGTAGYPGPYMAASAVPEQKVLINRMTGTIIVTATKRNLEKVEQYLDVVRKVMNRQVLVEAKIIEVTLSDALQFGIDWTFILSSSTDTATFSTTGFAGIVPVSSPAFSIATTAKDFTSLLKAIEQQGETRILSNPRISIMNGQTSILSVGTKTDFISKVTVTQPTVTGGSPTYAPETSSLLSGIMIGMVPFITETGEISLTITPITSDLVTMTPAPVGGTVTIQLPTIALREMSTTVKVRNGQMVILGGLIQEREELTDSQIPFLGDIPLLGYFFKSRNKLVRKTELVILLQPVIISR